MLWSRSRPPKLFPNSILTRHGWADPVTGELLVVLFSPDIGPGKNITQVQSGSARNEEIQTKQNQVSAHLSAPSNIGQGIPTRRAVITGTAKIICPRPFFTGINPNW